jgi:hypothetical protein
MGDRRMRADKALAFPGHRVAGLIGGDIEEARAVMHTAYGTLHGGRNFRRHPRQALAHLSTKVRFLCDELITNAMDSVIKILLEHREEIQVDWRPKKQLLQVCWHNELLFAICFTAHGYRILNPWVAFSLPAYGEGYGDKGGRGKSSGGLNCGAKQSGQYATEAGLKLKYEFQGHLDSNRRRVLVAEFGADPDFCHPTNPQHEGRMCVVLSSGGSGPQWNDKCALPLVETIVEVDGRVEMAATAAERVAFLHKHAMESLSCFEWMYDVDLAESAPGDGLKPCFRAAKCFFDERGEQVGGDLVHRDRYTPRVCRLLDGYEVALPAGMHEVLALRMYSLASRHHFSCNHVARAHPDLVMRDPGRGFDKKDEDGADADECPVEIFDGKERKCSVDKLHHSFRCKVDELLRAPNPAPFAEQLLPLLRGGTSELFGTCRGALWDHFWDFLEVTKQIRAQVLAAAARADTAAGKRERVDEGELQRMIANTPFPHTAFDASKFRYLAHLLGTFTIEASISDMHTAVFGGSSFQRSTLQERAMALVSGRPDVVASRVPAHLLKVVAHVFGANTKVRHLPLPPAAVLDDVYDFRHGESIALHQYGSSTEALRGLMALGEGKEELDKLLALEAGISVGGSDRLKREVTDEVRDLVKDLEAGADEDQKTNSGYASDTDPPKKRKASTLPPIKPPGGKKRKADAPDSDSGMSDDSVLEPKHGGDVGGDGDSDSESPGPSTSGGGGGGGGDDSDSDSGSECVKLDPKKIANLHPIVTGGFRPFHCCDRGKPLTYRDRTPLQVAEGVVVQVPAEAHARLNNAGGKQQIYSLHLVYERMLSYVKPALEAAGEWGGRDGNATSLVEAYCPEADWRGYWSADSQRIVINIGLVNRATNLPRTAIELGATLSHELAHHNTYGKERDPHGRKHQDETNRLRSIVEAYHEMMG